MTFEKLLALPVGSVLESGVLLPGLTGEKVFHVVRKSDPEKMLVRMNCFYFDVAIGSLLARPKNNGDIEWQHVTNKELAS